MFSGVLGNHMSYMGGECTYQQLVSYISNHLGNALRGMGNLHFFYIAIFQCVKHLVLNIHMHKDPLLFRPNHRSAFVRHT